MNTVITVSCALPEIDRAEVLRYAFAKEGSAETEKILNECLSELPDLTFKVCYSEIPTNEIKTDSTSLRKRLEGCESAIIFAATVGIGIDRLISRYSKLSPVKALMFQAIGAERIEALCNSFEEKLKNEGLILCPRFSPGYGDLDLNFQKYIFALLDCQKHIGLTLGESLVMSPSKSVTGVIGVRSRSDA